MKLPFTAEEFLGVFADYNRAIWPAQCFLLAAAVLAVLALVAHWPRRDRIVITVLAFLWGWSGLVYHLGFFAPINPVAVGFGFLFVVQSVFFFRLSLGRRGLRFSLAVSRRRRWAGAVLIGYALVIYPLIGFWAGQRWPALPTFGAPCPVTLFTFGVLLWGSRPCPRGILVIPMLWAIIGGSASVLLNIPEDLALPAGAIVAYYFLWPNRVQRRPLGRAPTSAEFAHLPPPSETK